MSDRGGRLQRSFMVSLALVAALCGVAVPAETAELTVGMSAAMSGPVRPLGRAMRLGVEVVEDEQADPIAVDATDLVDTPEVDGYVPEVAATNMQRLIEQEKVLLVLGNVGTPTAELTVPIANDSQTLLLGAMSGAGLLRRTPPDRY